MFRKTVWRAAAPAAVTAGLLDHPNANGSPGDAMASMTLSDGRTYKDAEAGGAV